ncbi:MAG: type II toxin-antitoxin system VapC family toxin [Rickettsiaceae bacterium]|nr:type II toxin-antitoxin system VapC family toxin [Rickettsiaceae bacterium]
MNLVVDCSFIMSSLLPDEKEQKIAEIYYQIAENKYKVYVPAIFYLECTNVLLSSLKRKRINKETYEEYINLLSLLPINVDNFSATPESLYSISKLSTTYNLTSYDASYLNLAIRIEASIATLDKNLTTVCRLAKIKLEI